MKIKNIFYHAPEEFCKEEKCKHQTYIDDLVMRIKLNPHINENPLLEGIDRIRLNECNTCLASKLYIFLERKSKTLSS